MSMKADHPFRPLHRQVPFGLALLLALGACSSVSLAPAPVVVALPRVPGAPVGMPVGTPVGVPQSPAPAASPSAVGVQVLPVDPGPAVLAAPMLAAPASAPPYGPAVAARFPDPLIRFDTPAFETGRSDYTSNDELQTALRNLVHDAQRSRNITVRLLALGTSQRGVPLEALLFTGQAQASPAAVVAAGRPTVLLVGQQHGDEPAGAEALLAVAQDLTRGRLQPLLERINVIILPRANPDGAQLNQRVTASGIDANRDHLLLRTPEAQAQAQLMREYRPLVVVDAHEYTVVGRYLEKFGAVQRFDALFQYATAANLPEFITRAAEEWFRQPLLASLRRESLTSEWYYTTSTDLADKKVSMGGVQPDTGRNVNGLKNAVSLLIETRGVGIGRLHLARRVYTHYTAIASVLSSTAARAADLVKLRDYVDKDVSGKACTGVAVVAAASTPSEKELLMLDPVTGADKSINVAWDSALELRDLKERPRPCGYWLGADQTDAVLRLRGLGIEVMRIEELGVMRGETYRETARDLGVREDVRGSIADAGGVVRVQVQTIPALIDVPAGSYYVPLDQPFANLVLAALEPDTQNSYLTNRIVSGVDREARVLQRPEQRMSVVP